MTGLAPIFVGGTGRSGTTIVGRLLAEQHGYVLVPIELRVHAAPGGLADLEGKVEVEWFIARLYDFWYERPSASGQPTGLVGICPRACFDRAVQEFAEAFTIDPLAAAATLVHRVVAPVLQDAGAAAWVEMTPHNAAAATTLARVFPTGAFRARHPLWPGRRCLPARTGLGARRRARLPAVVGGPAPCLPPRHGGRPARAPARP